jgi:EmrB/QacA subfamily drug resistance transporter
MGGSAELNRTCYERLLTDVSIVNVALPSMRQGLSASAADLQWVVSGYALTLGLTLIPSGRLGDARGRRLVFLVGIAVFTLASAACSAALSPLWLVVARLVQGIGGGLVAPQNSGLIQQLFRGAERARAFGYFGATIGVATAAGPITGGLLLKLLGTGEGWRAVFLINVPVGAFVLLAARRLLPANEGGGRRQDLDPVGVALLAAAIVLLLLPLMHGGSSGGPPVWLLGPAALAALGLVLWERRQRRAGRLPLINARLFRDSGYALGTALITLYFAGFTPIFFVLTLYLQSGQHYEPLLAGLAVSPFAFGNAVSALAGGRLVRRLGRAVVVAGQAVVITGLVLTLWAEWRHTGPGVGWWIAPPLLLGGLGAGLVVSPNQTLTLADVPVPEASTAGGMLQTAQRLGAAAGIAVVTALFFGAARGGGSGGASGGGSGGSGGSAAGYRDGLAVGLWVSIAFVTAGLALATVDLVLRLRQDRAARREGSPVRDAA